jgi:hypothetical protein
VEVGPILFDQELEGGVDLKHLSLYRARGPDALAR